MKLTTTQQTTLDAAIRLAHNFRETKGGAKIRARELVEREIASVQHELDRGIRLAVEAGVPKKRVYEDLRMSPNTVYESLARTESLADKLGDSEPVKVERFTWDDSSGERKLRITLAGEWWDTLKKELAPNIRKNADADSAEYPITDEGEIIPRYHWSDRTTPNKFDHPVSAWLSYYGGAEEAAEWLEGQE